MVETLGMLCDKLAIIMLKKYHSEDAEHLASLAREEKQMQKEREESLSNAVPGVIRYEKLTFASNKIYKKEASAIIDFEDTMGIVFVQLAFLNLERTTCIDKKDRLLTGLIKNKK